MQATFSRVTSSFMDLSKRSLVSFSDEQSPGRQPRCCWARLEQGHVPWSGLALGVLPWFYWGDPGSCLWHTDHLLFQSETHQSLLGLCKDVTQVKLSGVDSCHTLKGTRGPFTTRHLDSKDFNYAAAAGPT